MSNLFCGMQFRTCRIFWDFADHQSSLNPKKSYKYKSHTAITSIVISVANQLRIKCESAIFRHCEANLRIRQSNPNKNKIDCHDFATQNLAMIGKYSSLRGKAEAIQNNNELRVAQPNLARFVVQKSDSRVQ